MRRNLSIILTGVIVVAVLIGLSAASFVTLDRPDESELNPQRSSYNAGPTGARAFYQLLEESGAKVTRWKAGFEELSTIKSDVLIMIGPFPVAHQPSQSDKEALKRWVVSGGHLLIISRDATREFDDPGLRIISKAADEEWSKPTDAIADLTSDRLVVQPTRLTRGLKGLQLSTLASRIMIDRRAPIPAATATSPTPTALPESETEKTDTLSAPVVHLGDNDGAVLADFDYGDGRIVLLSDPFVVANNGIGRGANLNLALNLVNELAGSDRRVLFDEAHHGFRQTHNQLVTYFRGTPALWLAAQVLLVALLAAYTYGRRFARPLPLPQVDRHSPLEFVGSMANLQKLAAARDLALENIYPPFRAELCRTLGVSIRASATEMATALSRRASKKPGAHKISADELTRLLRDCEGALVGVPIDDHELVALVAGMRRIREDFKSSQTLHSA